MENLSKKILQIIENEGTNIYQMEKVIGVSNGVLREHIRNNNNKPLQTYVKKIAEAYPGSAHLLTKSSSPFRIQVPDKDSSSENTSIDIEQSPQYIALWKKYTALLEKYHNMIWR